MEMHTGTNAYPAYAASSRNGTAPGTPSAHSTPFSSTQCTSHAADASETWRRAPDGFGMRGSVLTADPGRLTCTTLYATLHAKLHYRCRGSQRTSEAPAARARGARRRIHGVGLEALAGRQRHAREHAVGARGHEGDVEVGRVHVLPRRQVLVPAGDLRARASGARSRASKASPCGVGRVRLCMGAPSVSRMHTSSHVIYTLHVHTLACRGALWLQCSRHSPVPIEQGSMRRHCLWHKQLTAALSARRLLARGASARPPGRARLLMVARVVSAQEGREQHQQLPPHCRAGPGPQPLGCGGPGLGQGSRQKSCRDEDA